jgi:glutathione synthase/RimK-type ligase-like ATP-grasp enzyme
VKVRGGTRGIGTIKIESWKNLISTVDYLLTTSDSFMLREFIEAEYGARIIVLGEETIWNNKFYFQENDFRNAALNIDTRYERLDIDDETKKICVEAVRSANLEMAGVDILFDGHGKPHLLEINFPTGFGSFKYNPEFVLSKMLGYLIEKSKRRDA